MTGAPLPSSRATDAFERRVARGLAALAPANAPLEGMPLVVACSGGADSTAALIAVSRSRGPDDAPVVAACFDHGLRPAREVAADRAAVDAVAERLGRRVLYGSVSDSGAPARRAGSEAAAREARYRWLADACAEAGAVRCVTGHTLDDQAETVLLRLTRGAGSPGVAAMAPEAPWPVPCEGGRLRLLRPLLGVRREEARAYLESLELQPRLDPTNDLLTFDRNRLRHRVLPQLRAVNPRAEEALARFALLARRDDEALEAWAEREAGKLVRMEVKTVAIRRRELLALPEAVSSRLLRRAAGEVGIALEGAQVEQLLHIARRRGARLSLTGGAAEVVGEELLIRPTREN